MGALCQFADSRSRRRRGVAIVPGSAICRLDGRAAQLMPRDGRARRPPAVIGAMAAGRNLAHRDRAVVAEAGASF